MGLMSSLLRAPAFRHWSSYSSCHLPVREHRLHASDGLRREDLHRGLPLRHVVAPEAWPPRAAVLCAGDLRLHGCSRPCSGRAPGPLPHRLRLLPRAAAGRQQQAQGHHWYANPSAHPQKPPFLIFAESRLMAAGSERNHVLRRHAVRRQALRPPDPPPGRGATRPRPPPETGGAPWASREAMTPGQHVAAAALGQAGIAGGVHQRVAGGHGGDGPVALQQVLFSQRQK